MSTITITKFSSVSYTSSKIRNQRIESIDLLRGIVMIIMVLDHVRDYFHRDAFYYSPTDLSKASVFLFLTRFITHYCAPVFVFLAGISAYLYGTKKSKRELALYLLTRGIWMVFVELFIISLGWTFNPTYRMFNLQVIWAIGISMIVLSALIYLNRNVILAIAVLLLAGHNLLDNVHVPGNGGLNFLWSLLHEDRDFVFGHTSVFVHYPVMPWIGIITLGYYFGGLYHQNYDTNKRKEILFTVGIAAIVSFFLLRPFNVYGDPSPWSYTQNLGYSILSVLNVTKYPPSLLYVLITLGPAMIFLSLAEGPLNAVTKKIAVFGRVPFFYYVLHIYLVHLLAVIAAIVSGYNWSDMILTNRVNRVPGLKGYGFNLLTVYIVWIGVVVALYPCCKWFDRYKRAYQSGSAWLTYF
jgi:uncharacterized membrane protein